mgnify:CR=1 FL=1
MFSRDLHNALKLSVNNGFIVSLNDVYLYRECVMSKRIGEENIITFILSLSSDVNLTFHSADEALRALYFWSQQVDRTRAKS